MASRISRNRHLIKVEILRKWNTQEPIACPHGTRTRSNISTTARSGLPSSSGSKPSSANSQKTTRKFHMQQEIKKLSRITDFLTRDNCYKMLQNYFRLVLLNNGTEDLSSKESQFFFHNGITKFSLPQNNEITSVRF